MSQRITLEPTDDVPAGSTVCHYDELSEAAKELFPDLAGESDPGDDFDAVDGDAADGLRRCDFVKYTDYYEISVN